MFQYMKILFMKMLFRFKTIIKLIEKCNKIKFKKINKKKRNKKIHGMLVFLVIKKKKVTKIDFFLLFLILIYKGY